MWTLAKGIKTPKGVYTPKTDDLITEIMAAAKFAGLESFNVKVDGEYIDTPEEMTTKDFFDVSAVEIEPYDIAG